MAQAVPIKVVVSNAAEIKRLNAALELMRAGPGARPVTPTRGSVVERLAEGFGREVIGNTIRAPFVMATGAARLAEVSLLGFLGPLARLAVVSATTTPTLLAFGIAVVTLGPPLFYLAATIKLLRLSFGWAEDAADAQLQIMARTKRSFPGLTGEALTKAQDTIYTKIGVASALFGESADAIANSLTQRFSEAQMKRGIRGEKDIFERWGINAESVKIYESMRGGERISLTDWVGLFIQQREELDARILAQRGTRGEAQAAKTKATLIADSIKLFGDRFGNIIADFSKEDLKHLSDNIEATLPLASIPDADQTTRNFKIAVWSLHETFTQIKRGIAGDLMPTYTEIMTKIRDWLIHTGDDGIMMGSRIRELVSAVAIHGWKSLQILLDEINPDDVRALINDIREWKPQNTITNLKTAARLIERLASTLAEVPDWWTGVKQRYNETRKRAAALSLEIKAREQARGGSSWMDKLPSFIPGAPGYAKQQEGIKQQEAELAAAKAAAATPAPATSAPATPAPVTPAPTVPAGATPPTAVAPLQAAPGYHPNISREDPRLMNALTQAQAAMPPGYTVKITSGYRAPNPRTGKGYGSQHRFGTAIDIQIFRPDGSPLPNSGEDESKLYTRYARATYGVILQQHPELKGFFNWGGAFPTERGRPDLMHYDIGGVRGRFSRYRIDKLGPLFLGGPVNATLQPTPAVPQPATATAGRPVIPPQMQTPENLAALREVGERFGIDPIAIAGVINTESKWHLGAVTGRYRGLTQIGPENPEWGGIGRMSAADQIRTYGRWLERYHFAQKTQAAGVDFSRMTPAGQAAYLQGFQFAPNAMRWQRAAGQGIFGVRSTRTRQARALGSTSLQAMANYYQYLLGGQTLPDTERLTAKPPENVIKEGTAAGEAAAKAFKDGIEDVKIPIKPLTDEEKEREKTRADRDKAA